MNTENKWKQMTSFKEHFYFTTIREPKIRVKSSIWFAQRSTEADGMVEYHPDSDTTAKIIDYPATFKNVKTRWTRIVSCKYKDDEIVIISWYHRCGFVFDTKTREFRRNHFSFWSKAGMPTSCVAIGDYHIFSFHLQEKQCSHTSRSCSHHSQKPNFCVQQQSNDAIFVAHIYCIPSTFCHTHIPCT